MAPLDSSTRTTGDDGVLLVGHGTRDPAGVAEFLQAAEDRSPAKRARPLEPCFLEIAQPTIAEGFARLVERGVRRVTVVPLLLFAAGHAKRDIPALVAEAAARHGSLPMRHAPPLECHPRVLELSTRRFREALASCSPVEPADTMLVMVGRGSSDAEAAAEMRRFSQLRRELTPVCGLETCFVAKQRPTLPEALSAAASSNFRRIVVQPHLLFTGQLIGDIRREVQRASGSQLPASLARCNLPRAAVETVPQAMDPELTAAPAGSRAESQLIDAIVRDALASGRPGRLATRAGYRRCGKNSLKNPAGELTEGGPNKVA